MINYESYWGNNFAAESQRLHAWCGGDRDISISGMMWTIGGWRQKYINFTFKLIDGPDHCEKSYRRDLGENYDRKPNMIAVSIIIILFCTLVNVLVNPFLFMIKIFK